MAVKWTEEQKKVITLRDRNILVSAAAGSSDHDIYKGGSGRDAGTYRAWTGSGTG